MFTQLLNYIDQHHPGCTCVSTWLPPLFERITQSERVNFPDIFIMQWKQTHNYRSILPTCSLECQHAQQRAAWSSKLFENQLIISVLVSTTKMAKINFRFGKVKKCRVAKCLRVNNDNARAFYMGCLNDSIPVNWNW